MIDIREWMTRLLEQLQDAFGARLLFVGLQGSYRRGEATAASDFDVVVVLDVLALEDLRRYRAILDGMPEREKACGFVGGREELARWPKHELFQFRNDTEAWHGALDDILPPVSRRDIAASVTYAASGLYHAACHLFLHGGEERENVLRGLYKGAFFPLLAAHYLRTGEYAGSKKELLRRLEGGEREILRLSMEWDGSEDLDRCFSLLLTWAGDVLRKGEFDGE